MASAKDPDIYDLEVERLTRHPKHISSAWHTNAKTGLVNSPLFSFVSYDGKTHGEAVCGCLTQIRNNPRQYLALRRDGNIDQELTAQIAGDSRLPTLPGHITLAHLPIFAEWQRKIDERLERKDCHVGNEA